MLFELRRIGFAVHGAEFHLCTVCIHSEGDVSQLSDGLIGIRHPRAMVIRQTNR